MAELIEDGVNGRLVPPNDPRALSRAIAAIAADPASTIDAWRSRLPAVRTMEDVARDYMALYTR
jgi:glycosyltransferase involved in cell wall biosynthesis